MKQYIIALIALLTLAIVPSALAMTVTVKDSSASPVSVQIGETIPIVVTETASANYSNVVVTAELVYNGKKVDVDTGAFDMIEGTTYPKTLNLKIPANIKTTAPGESYNLDVRMQDNKGTEIDWQQFEVTVQRTNEEITVQKVMTTFAKAGSPTLVTIVAKNTGSDDIDDVYAKVSIPQLSLVAEERLGNLAAMDNGDSENVATADVPLRIPENTEDGTYPLVVEVYSDNGDVDTSVTKSIVINGVAPAEKFVEVVPSLESQDIEQGKTTTYTISVANLGASAKTYSVSVEGTEGWATTSQINPITVTLAPESSQTITIAVTATNTALIGEHKFSVNIKSDDAEKSISLTANVKGKTVGIDALLISVIVLAIVLVILIAVLVKTRKGDEGIETEESYY